MFVIRGVVGGKDNVRLVRVIFDCETKGEPFSHSRIVERESEIERDLIFNESCRSAT